MNNIFIHESSYVDEDVIIGGNTRILAFCQYQKGDPIGKTGF